jgi:hypothetical protein
MSKRALFLWKALKLRPFVFQISVAFGEYGA